jgi:hypothetical protein
MAIYVDNLGSTSLPVELNNPQENETLVWDDTAGAFINAPAPVPTEEIQDTVADMIEVDPDGSELSLKLVSSYDDVTGKITFNVVTGTGSGGSASGVVIKENGTTRGTATTLDFVGPSISFASGVATITGLMSSIGVKDNGVNIGNVQNLDFTNLTLTIVGDTLRVDGPDLSTISNTIEVQQGGVVKGDITKLNFSGATVGVAGDTATITITGGGGAGATNLDGLTDVVLSSPTAGQVLKYNGTNWVNDTDNTGTTITSLDDIGDVNLTGILTGQLLGWNGSQWVPVNNSGATGPQGPIGPAGATGAQVSSGSVSGGTLTLYLSDGSSVVVAGSVAGPQGATGAQGPAGATGPAGTSVTSATVSVTGRLLITLSNGLIVDAGNVAGVSGAAINGTGDLIITKQDGTTINAGSAVGPTGQAATIAVGAVTTGSPGSAVVVTNSGTPGAAVLDFTIPKGDTGEAFELNGVTGTADILGIASTTVPGYDLEVDSANKWRTARNFTLLGKVTGIATGVDGSSNVSISTSLNATSDDISEGTTNRFYTDARSRSAVSATSSTGITYNSGTGVFSLGSIPNTSLAASTITVNGITISLGGGGTLSTTNIGEGTNQYFTNARADARADSRIAASSINALSDVDTVTIPPISGQSLVWNGTAWVPQTVSGGGGGAVASVNGYTGAITLYTDDIAEDASPTNKYFTDARARAAVSLNSDDTSLLSYNSSTGQFTWNTPNTDSIEEGSANLYYTNTRFDSRLSQSNLGQLADVADTTPTDGQVLTYNETAGQWQPSTAAGVGTSIVRQAIKVNYDQQGNLISVEVLNGSGTATVVDGNRDVATVEFTLTGMAAPPLSVVVYGYQVLTNTYTMRHVDNATWDVKKFSAGGSSGAPNMWTAWNSSIHKMTLGLTRAITLASATVTNPATHCVVQITGIA